MRWNVGVLAGLLFGLLWLTVGVVLVVFGQRRKRTSTAEGAGSIGIIGVFLAVVGVLSLFATLLLSVVPGAG